MSEEKKIPQEEIPQEQPGNNKPIDEINSSAEPVTESDQLSTLNPIAIGSQLSTEENMETHAHHLHKTPGHGWKHYFFEFFMLFLAVSLGFFVENQREHYVEQQREKEFAQQLYLELSDDSTIASTRLKRRIAKEKDMDYLSSFFRDSTLTPLPRDVYPAFTTSAYLINAYAFEPKDGILSQLRNSGSLRYFKSIALQKLLGDISVCINNMRYRNEQEYQFFANPIKPFMLKHYDFKWVDQLRKEAGDGNIYDIINQYRQGNSAIEAQIPNLSSFDRSEASNIIMFYKQMVVSTRTLQLNDYIVTNHKILDELRNEYDLQ